MNTQKINKFSLALVAAVLTVSLSNISYAHEDESGSEVLTCQSDTQSDLTVQVTMIPFQAKMDLKLRQSLTKKEDVQTLEEIDLTYEMACSPQRSGNKLCYYDTLYEIDENEAGPGAVFEQSVVATSTIEKTYDSEGKVAQVKLFFIFPKTQIAFNGSCK